MITDKLKCFKAYDIRGKVPEELNADLAYKIAVAYAKLIKPTIVIVGYDVRLESPMLADAIIKGLTDSGVSVVNIGLCGTEEVYFHTWNRENEGVDGGIMITASHNPKGYNGIKMVKQGSRPISMENELGKIQDYLLTHNVLTHNVVKSSEFLDKHCRQTIQKDKSDYIKHLLSYVNINKLKPLKIVVNPGNGPAGEVIKLLQKSLPFQFIYIHDEPDGNFPNGVPNPMLPGNRIVTSDAVRRNRADLGIAWDGDFDRCFFFDEKGNFVEGYYIVGLLAASFLKKHPGSKIIHDPRLVWNTQNIVKEFSGIAVQSKSGHSFIKAKMRSENAVYGGEMSAHHYFRDFAYCDSGMIPWLLIADLLSTNYGKVTKLSNIIEQSQSAYPCSGEINYKVNNVAKVISSIESHFRPQKPVIDYTDGLAMEFSNWRFNLRSSNTEPLLRLNLETKGSNVSIIELVKDIQFVIDRNN